VNKYQVILCWSEDDQVYVAEVPELPGCVAHGATQIDALQNANDAVRLWVETAREFGDAIPEPRGWRLLLACAVPGDSRLEREAPPLGAAGEAPRCGIRSTRAG